jgi:hypothetical protein
MSTCAAAASMYSMLLGKMMLWHARCGVLFCSYLPLSR